MPYMYGVDRRQHKTHGLKKNAELKYPMCVRELRYCATAAGVDAEKVAVLATKCGRSYGASEVSNNSGLTMDQITQVLFFCGYVEIFLDSLETGPITIRPRRTFIQPSSLKQRGKHI